MTDHMQAVRIRAKCRRFIITIFGLLRDLSVSAVVRFGMDSYDAEILRAKGERCKDSLFWILDFEFWI